jgi:hypothetical protein
MRSSHTLRVLERVLLSNPRSSTMATARTPAPLCPARRACTTCLSSWELPSRLAPCSWSPWPPSPSACADGPLTASSVSGRSFLPLRPPSAGGGASPPSQSQSHATASARERAPLSFPSGSGSAASFPCGFLWFAANRQRPCRQLCANGTFRLPLDCANCEVISTQIFWYAEASAIFSNIASHKWLRGTFTLAGGPRVLCCRTLMMTSSMNHIQFDARMSEQGFLNTYFNPETELVLPAEQYNCMSMHVCFLGSKNASILHFTNIKPESILWKFRCWQKGVLETCNAWSALRHELDASIDRSPKP